MQIMEIRDYYQQLGLTTDANLAEVKASYRRLARQYHPDVNPGNQAAQDKFIAITEAYKFLLNLVTTPPAPAPSPKPQRKSEVKVKVQKPSTHQPPTPSTSVPPQASYSLSETEQILKQNSYLRLQYQLKSQKFPQAIALIEGLAQRMPQDLEIRQWQAIVYQRWARHLIQEKQIEKARIYLKKALKTDPHNRALWSEVERDFRKLEQIF